jgi:hypothetical protein
MQPVPIHPGLSHRLLVAVARTHYDGDPPLDAQHLTVVAGRASAKSINRAVDHLANAGLIEGVNTPAGWMAIRPTARGLSRAGRAARRPVAIVLPSSDHVTPLTEAQSEAAEPITDRARVLADQSLRRAVALSVAAQERLSRSISPRLTSVRTTMVQAWHTFTTLP